MRRGALDVLALVFVVALVMVLVRPSSQGPAFVTTLTAAVVALVGAATDTAKPAETTGGGTWI